MAETQRTAPTAAPFLLDVQTIEGARCARAVVQDGPFRLGVQAIECGTSDHWVLVLRDFIGAAEVMIEIQEFAGDVEALRKHVELLGDRWQLDPSFVFQNPRVKS